MVYSRLISFPSQVAQENFEHAGVADKIDLILGPAAESLKKLPSSEPFDFVFVDADKQSNPTYYREARRLTRKGGIIVSLCILVRSSALMNLTTR